MLVGRFDNQGIQVDFALKNTEKSLPTEHSPGDLVT